MRGSAGYWGFEPGYRTHLRSPTNHRPRRAPLDQSRRATPASPYTRRDRAAVIKILRRHTAFIMRTSANPSIVFPSTLFVAVPVTVKPIQPAGYATRTYFPEIFEPVQDRCETFDQRRSLSLEEPSRASDTPRWKSNAFQTTGEITAPSLDSSSAPNKFECSSRIDLLAREAPLRSRVGR